VVVGGGGCIGSGGGWWWEPGGVGMDPASSFLFRGGGPGGTGGEKASTGIVVDRSAPRPATPPLSTLDAGDA
jgi:hypothetical protein